MALHTLAKLNGYKFKVNFFTTKPNILIPHEITFNVQPDTEDSIFSPIGIFCSDSACDGFVCDSDWCISNSWVCDGMEDCSNGEDEANCDTTTSPTPTTSTTTSSTASTTTSGKHG